jgi:diguanylate cyclase (GGDEF)-like protein/putative nucleotidyltransferase with HDIG domain
MLGFAAWQPEERRESVALEGLRLLAAPAVFGVVAIGLLAYGNVRDLGGEGAILATAALVGVIARMTIAFRENMSLTAGLRNANERAATDPLTGLPNHRTFHERLNAEVERARRYGRELSLVVLDLDNFKNVNDVHGHQLGDAVLREIGLRLSRHVRAGDTLGRIGGEEFGWILPDADGLDAWDAAERARLAIAEEPIPGVGAVTVSAGICDLAYGKTAADMFRLADGALYWAKLDGRNAAHRYTPEVVSALSAEERAQLLEHSQALGAIRVLARAVDAKDATTQRHSERVAELAGLIAEVLGWPASRVELLREAGLVHDVGKIGVPDAILRKPGWLTDEEYELIKGHAALSAQMVSEVLSAEQVAWVRGHHERWDGRGYPDALAGEEIPLGARVLAAADAWDAMTASRPYREALSAREALAELERGVSTQWCPAVAGALMAMLEVDLVPASEARERALAVG